MESCWVYKLFYKIPADIDINDFDIDRIHEFEFKYGKFINFDERKKKFMKQKPRRLYRVKYIKNTT